MVNYWICITNDANWKVVKEKLVWGIPKHYCRLVFRVNKGDLLVFYLRPKRIGGIFEIISNVFNDETGIFNSQALKPDETFPYRMKIKPIFILDEFIPIDDFISKLRFIVSKTAWPGYFRHAMVQIPREDYDVLYKAIASKSSKKRAR